MHKLDLYLNNDRYEKLSLIAENSLYDSAEEYANELLYVELDRIWRSTHDGDDDVLKNFPASSPEAKIVVPEMPPRCPICGRLMRLTGAEDYSLIYSCNVCDVEARLAPSPDLPDDCKAEFSYGNIAAEARLRSSLERPGYTVTIFIYTAFDVARVEVANVDKEGLTFSDLESLAAEAFTAYLPFSGRYSVDSIEKSLMEYKMERGL